MTQEDKPIAIILPNWNSNEPRFIVEDAHDGLADDRAFKNGKCVYNQRLGIVYTVEYVVDALNELGDEIDKLKEENEQLRMKLKGDDYIMVSEMLSNLRKTGICDGCKNKDKPVEWYLERGFSITGRVCDRYEPE